MDPTTLSTLIATGISAVVYVIGAIVQAKFFPGASAPPVSQPGASLLPAINWLVTSVGNLLKAPAASAVTSAVQGSIGAVAVPVLRQILQQFDAALQAASPSPPTVPAPTQTAPPTKAA